MPLAFNIENITVMEFGVGREGDNDWIVAMVPVDASVQAALQEMARATWDAIRWNEDDPAQYQPSEKHGSTEYLLLARGSDLEMDVRKLYDAHNLQIDATALNEPKGILFYFARFVDDQNRRLTALRRASQFKGVLKSRLLRVVDDSLRIVEDEIFKLDSDFDLLVDSEHTHIWRPSAFEFVSGLKQAILDAVPTNVDVIRQDMTYVDFENVGRYASTRSRAARYLTSIRTQDLAGIERQALIDLCESTGVQLENVDGMVRVADPHVMGFLEVLDRRRYQVKLVPDAHERFRATSRREIQDA